ncbi:Vacuolar protein sorting-associated protein 16 [Phytophthora cinnamomi]|uniref:Vacuolar protein sorting-associated protein 16 n=1 Tax=Phytophthora cinnamomi TaxID=4785 RepID=UPI003559A8A8|nr:Vacuolar protein sorting-associated protein 16 [Phytophthora cinnamomi]
MATRDGPSGDVSAGSTRELKQTSTKHTAPQDQETSPEFNGKTPTGSTTPLPARKTSSTENTWQRKRSSLLLVAMHPEGARETANFVERLPRSTALRVMLALFAYALLVSDVPRGGPNVQSLPFVQIEPNVFTVYGPTALPSQAVYRNGTATIDGVMADLPTAFYNSIPPGPNAF